MDTQTIILAFSAFLIASFLKGLTGLGFSTLCLGFLSIFMDLKVAIPLVFLPSLSSNIMVMIEAGRFFEAFKRFWPLYLGTLPGLLLGIWILGTTQNQSPKVILGTVMLIYGIWALKNKLLQLSKSKERRLMAPIGLLSGLVNGVTGSQIMPIMPYLLSVKMDRDLFVQTINSSFTFSTIIMIIGLGKLGLVTTSIISISAMGILPVAVGIFFGGQLRKRVADETYRKMVLILLIVLGCTLIIKPFVYKFF
ncbi:MAG: sulfite exporter TauE/SafE family protein [Deltaproteobacteria bacterium]|nr:sulfite exporter TauE/SafE family protein [Deltaproteobacteria bacterium]